MLAKKEGKGWREEVREKVREINGVWLPLQETAMRILDNEDEMESAWDYLTSKKSPSDKLTAKFCNALFVTATVLHTSPSLIRKQVMTITEGLYLVYGEGEFFKRPSHMKELMRAHSHYYDLAVAMKGGRPREERSRTVMNALNKIFREVRCADRYEAIGCFLRVAFPERGWDAQAVGVLVNRHKKKANEIQ